MTGDGEAGVIPIAAGRLARVALLYALVVLGIYFGPVWSLIHSTTLADLGTFIASGQAAARGLDPYGAYGLTFKFADGGAADYAINRNPPLSVLFFQLFLPWRPEAVFRAWYGLSLLCYLAAVALLSRAYREQASALRVVWALCLAGVWSTLTLGQLYLPLVLLAVGAWLMLRRGQQRGAGLLIGALVAIKPNFAVWPALLFLAGDVTTALVAAGVAGGLSVLPALVYGPRIYQQWVATFASQPWVGYPTNGSLLGLAARLGVPWLGVALSVALLVSASVWTWRRRPSSLNASALALSASILASPEAWSGYSLFLLPLFFRRSWTPPLAIAGALLLVPDTLVEAWSALSTWQFVLFGFLSNLALALVLAGVIQQAVAERGAAAAQREANAGRSRHSSRISPTSASTSARL